MNYLDEDPDGIIEDIRDYNRRELQKEHDLNEISMRIFKVPFNYLDEVFKDEEVLESARTQVRNLLTNKRC